jgi:hypothetical protein
MAQQSSTLAHLYCFEDGTEGEAGLFRFLPAIF